MIVEIILACTNVNCAESIPQKDLVEVVNFYERNDVELRFVENKQNKLRIYSDAYSPETHIKLSKVIRDSNKIDASHNVMVVLPEGTESEYHGWASLHQQTAYVVSNTEVPTPNLIAHEIGHLRGHPHYCDMQSHPIKKDVDEIKKICINAENDLMHANSCRKKRLRFCKFDQSTRFPYRMWETLRKIQEHYLEN